MSTLEEENADTFAPLERRMVPVQTIMTPRPELV